MLCEEHIQEILDDLDGSVSPQKLKEKLYSVCEESLEEGDIFVPVVSNCSSVSYSGEHSISFDPLM